MAFRALTQQGFFRLLKELLKVDDFKQAIVFLSQSINVWQAKILTPIFRYDRIAYE
jgi:hypothetical protein